MKNKEQRKTIIAIVLAVLLVLAVFLADKNINSSRGIINIKVNKYMEIFEGTDLSIIYVSKSSCIYCTKIKPHLKDVADKYNLPIYNIDLEKLTSSDESTFVNSNEFLKEGNWGTPTLMLVKDGKVVDTSVGYVEKLQIEQFLSKNGLIDESSVTDTGEDAFTKINVEQYLEKLKGTEKSIIYIGRPTCGYCLKTNPILAEIIKENEIEINYLNMDEIASQEEYDKFINSNQFIKDGQWGTPLILIVKDNEIVDKAIGYMEKADFVTFFKKTEMIQ